MNELDNLWHPEKMLEVQLKEPDDFLKVRGNPYKNRRGVKKR